MKIDRRRTRASIAAGIAALGVAAGVWLASTTRDGGGARAWTSAEAGGRIPLLRVTTFQGRRRSIGPSFHHPRCMNCHGFHVPNEIGAAHVADGRAAMSCPVCHVIPVWHAPAATFDLASKSLNEACVFAKNKLGNDPVLMANHLKDDPLILWAVSNGVRPDGKLAPGGTAPPGDLAVWYDRIDRWIAAGMSCE